MTKAVYTLGAKFEFMGLALCGSLNWMTARAISLFRGQFLRGSRVVCFSNHSRSTFLQLSKRKNRLSSIQYCRISNMPGKKRELLRYVRLSEYAVAPSKGSPLAAGYDLCSAYEYTIKPMSNALCKTDLQISLPDGCYGRVAPRSGLAVKQFIDVGAGVVDADYRGNLCVVVFNFGKEDFNVKRGDRIAQLICEKISYPELEEVQSLDETERGEAGFGSTGR